MPITVLDNALASQIVAALRDERTPPAQFRVLTRRLSYLLTSEAVRRLPTREICVKTPLEETGGVVIEHQIVVVPVLRAGLGMLDPVLEMLPDAVVGHVGLQRNEETAIADSYYSKLPTLHDSTVLLLDPMLATGGSAERAARRLYEAGARHIIMLCVVAAPEGVSRLAEAFPGMQIVAAALDRELNDKKYILPGLGDFGDRLYGTG
jgi:uracil phosphoribosyltransferase